MSHVPTFPLQQWLGTTLPEVAALAERHGLSGGDWKRRLAEVQEFRLRIPILGDFSAGKTSLINALLGEPLFSMDVTPETAVAAEMPVGTLRQRRQDPQAVGSGEGAVSAHSGGAFGLCKFGSLQPRRPVGTLGQRRSWRLALGTLNVVSPS